MPTSEIDFWTLAGELVDLEHSQEEIEKAVASIPD